MTPKRLIGNTALILSLLFGLSSSSDESKVKTGDFKNTQNSLADILSDESYFDTQVILETSEFKLHIQQTDTPDRLSVKRTDDSVDSLPEISMTSEELISSLGHYSFTNASISYQVSENVRVVIHLEAYGRNLFDPKALEIVYSFSEMDISRVFNTALTEPTLSFIRISRPGSNQEITQVLFLVEDNLHIDTWLPQVNNDTTLAIRLNTSGIETGLITQLIPEVTTSSNAQELVTQTEMTTEERLFQGQAIDSNIIIFR